MVTYSRRVEDELDGVFKALADPTRRTLLDLLADDDGQTLSALVEAFPEMTRFGVMKHLRLLEAAHLVVAEKHGREKLHFLNPVPIREIHDRWISRYAEPHVAGLLALRARSEGA
jgi:DNA-binding transcriptional ArsR family regulator